METMEENLALNMTERSDNPNMEDHLGVDAGSEPDQEIQMPGDDEDSDGDDQVRREGAL